MPDPDISRAEAVWRRRASRLAWKLNFHHGLARAVPGLALVLALLTVGELFRREAALPARWSGAFLLGGTAVALGWAWVRARAHFCRPDQALVRLETVLGLHNRLSAAQAGILPWPPLSSRENDGYVVNWKLIFLPLLAGVAFAVTAHLLPIRHLKAETKSGLISEPPDLTQVQHWLDTLQAAQLVEPEKLQDLQSSLNKLRDRPPQDWYTQSNLEAANSLKELTEHSMNTLSHDLDQADRAVQAMSGSPAKSPDGAGLQPLQDELRRADEKLASGNLPLNREFVDQLHGGENAQDKPLNAAQLKALHARLEQGKRAAQAAPKANGGLSNEMQAAMLAAGQGRGPGRRGFVPGGRGGGEKTAPLELQPRDKPTDAGPITPVHSEDMSRAALGETLRVTAGNPTVNPADYRGTQNAGAAQVQGSGGEAVWRSTYDPRDADVLAQFFK